MMTYKNRTDVTNHTLNTVCDYNSDDDDDDGECSTKTKMMIYRLYLSSSQLRQYLIWLTADELLIYDSIIRTYPITRKGMRFPELCQKLDDINNE